MSTSTRPTPICASCCAAVSRRGAGAWPSRGFAALGARLGNEIEDLAAEADRQTPTLRVRDKRGERVDEVVPSRAYRELERILYGEYGLAAMSLRPGVWLADRLARCVLERCLHLSGDAGGVGPLLPTQHDARAGAHTAQVRPSGRRSTHYLPRLTAH